MSRGRSRTLGIEPLGRVLARDSHLRVPDAIETTPVAARDWEAAVGSRIAARARPVRIDRGVLVVRTATSTWAQELSLLSEAILSQLRGRGVVVQALRFQVGAVDTLTRPPSRAEVRRSPPEVPLPPMVGAVVEQVADLDLRAVIARAAAKNLGWLADGSRGDAPRGDDTRGDDTRGGVTSGRSAARAPRSAGPGSGPSAQTTRTPREGRRGKP
jgi:Dna[CI] antecedent, DciA